MEKRPANLEIEVERELLGESVRRARLVSLIYSFMFLGFGVMIQKPLNRFSPEIPFTENISLRLLLNTIPWLLVACFLSRDWFSLRARLLCFAVLQAAIFNVSGWIYVWPITISVSPDILLYVATANTQFFVAAVALVCPPRGILFQYIFFLTGLSLAGLLYVGSKCSDPFLVGMCISDILVTVFGTTVWAINLNRGFREFALLRAQQKHQASQFLGKEIHSAIFEDKKELLEEKLTHGFVLSLDIRDSSMMTREFGDRWAKFVREWMAIAPELVQQSRGKLIKTAGDSLLITFGVFEEEVDLSDIPDLAPDVANADERRWNFLTNNVLTCAEELIRRFQSLAKNSFSEKTVRIGIGIDRGKVWTGVRGSDVRKELDIWGDSVNCASRLETYSKTLLSRFSSDASLLVLSPFAVDYLNGFDGYVKVETHSEIKDFSGIKWVLVKEYISAQSNEHSSKVA